MTQQLLYQVLQKHHLLEYTVFQHKHVLFHFYFVLLYAKVTGQDVDQRHLQNVHSTLPLMVPMY